jgi:hypothetical protein
MARIKADKEWDEGTGGDRLETWMKRKWLWGSPEPIRGCRANGDYGIIKLHEDSSILYSESKRNTWNLKTEVTSSSETLTTTGLYEVVFQKEPESYSTPLCEPHISLEIAIFLYHKHRV